MLENNFYYLRNLCARERLLTKDLETWASLIAWLVACSAGDPSSIPGLGRSPGEEKGYPLQYSGLENSMGCIVHGHSDMTEPISLHFWKLTQFSCITIAQSWPTLWPHGLQHARLPSPSLSPGVCSNSCSLSRWCHPTTLSSVTPSFSGP